MKKIILPCLSLVLFAASPAFAGSDHSHGDEHHPRYGGVVTEVNAVQYELVAKPDSIAIFIEDHGKKVDTRGAAAKVTLLNGSEKTVIDLQPAGENKLEAKGAFNVTPLTKAIATVMVAGKPAKSMRFTLQ